MRFNKIVTLATITVLSLAACSSSSGTGDQSASPSATEPTSDTVKLLTYESYAISDATLEAFTKESGLKVEIVKAGDSGAMVNRALLTKENPEGDLLFGIDDSLISRALDEELFVQYQPEAADQIPGDVKVNVDDRLTPIDTGDVCINYDRKYFEDNKLAPPDSLDDLTEPEFKDLLVVENPATSSPGLAFLLASVARYGEENYLDFWKSLKANGVLVENSWSKAYNGQFSGSSGGGDRPVVVSYATSPAAEVIFAEKKPKEAATAAALNTCYQQTEFAGVLANSENEVGAKRLLDFMLTKTYQDDIPLNNFVYPVMPDATLPPEFIEYAPEPQDVIRLAPSQVAEHRDEWVKEWTDTMQR